MTFVAIDNHGAREPAWPEHGVLYDIYVVQEGWVRMRVTRIWTDGHGDELLTIEGTVSRGLGEAHDGLTVLHGRHVIAWHRAGGTE